MCLSQRGIVPALHQKESLISPLFCPSPIKKGTPLNQARKTSHSSSHGGLSELHADEKLNMQSPMPNFRMNASGNNCAMYGLNHLHQFELIAQQQHKKYNSTIKKPVAATPIKNIMLDDQQVTPPGRMPDYSSRQLESTQTHSHKGASLDRDTRESMLGLFHNFTDSKLLAPPRYGLGDYQHESILSAQTTPIKPSMRRQPVQQQQQVHNAYYYNTELKDTKGKRRLFQNNVESMQQDSQQPFAHRLSLFSQSQQSCDPQSADKRQQSLLDLELGVKRSRDPDINPNFHTPYQQKKQWKKLNSLSRSGLKRSIELDSDDDEDFDENESPVHRKKRGLKILSVKVLELVEREGQTTYKDVANDLIKQLGQGHKGGEGLSDLDDSGDEEEDMTEDSPDKKGGSASKREADGQDQKWVKNVRRRVYDALNVLYAAGVLRKGGKHVSCDPDVLEMTRAIKSELSEQQESESVAKSAEKVPANAYEQKLKAEIEDLQRQIDAQEKRNEEIREGVSENIKHLICYKHLLERNQKFEHSGEITYDQPKVQLPFILMASKDTKENDIGVFYGKDCKSVAIGSSMPLAFLGDMDMLLKLNFHRVPQEWVEEQMRPYSIERAIGALSERQRAQIFYSGTEQ
ncbi:hypothetical protein FGO68_gene10086 [Halteria grandinella]|uniref:E2F/DP family winged-helix DNA-binding domain-containing protein n=1 Tax=Halteria grandinella TaxID=5974 RepID=A0A8J8SX90_HALGN|nr:hypothetical protein FGO68_gene10086 [Halteria grandinella]